MTARAELVDPLSPIISVMPLFTELLDGHPDWVERKSSEKLALCLERGFMNYRYLARRSPVFRKLDPSPASRELLGRIKARSEPFEA